MIDQDSINKFLGCFKKSVTEKGLLLIQRHKNLETITKLGLTLRDICKEILTLDYRDYISGPKEDRDFPGGVREGDRT